MIDHTKTIEALTLEIDRLRAALTKLADTNFDWSEDCGGQIPYDEWVSHTAYKALSTITTGEEHLMGFPIKWTELER